MAEAPLKKGRAAPNTRWVLDLQTGSPGQVAGVTEPALLLRVGVAAVSTDKEAAVQALPFAADEEPVGLQAVGTVGLVQVGCVWEQLPLRAFLFNLALQSPCENIGNKKKYIGHLVFAAGCTHADTESRDPESGKGTHRQPFLPRGRLAGWVQTGTVWAG